MSQLSIFRTEEFAPRRGVEEEVGDRDGGAAGQGGVVHVVDFATGDLNAGTGGFLAGGGLQRNPGDGSDGGQRFAAKAEGGDGEQVVDGSQLAGGVALKGQEGIVAVHAMAVVGDADEPPAARFDFNPDAVGPGVEGVLQQFFDYRSRAVHHLASGDLIGDLVGQYADAAHKG